MKGLHKIRQKWNDSKFGRNDISVRIYLSFVVVLAVSLLLTGAIFNYLYQRNYTRSYTELLTKQGKKIARRVSKFQYKKNVGQYENIPFILMRLRVQRTQMYGSSAIIRRKMP